MIFQVENRNQPTTFRIVDGVAVNNWFLKGLYFRNSPTQAAYASETWLSGPYGSVRHQCELHWVNGGFKEVDLIGFNK